MIVVTYRESDGLAHSIPTCTLQKNVILPVGGASSGTASPSSGRSSSLCSIDEEEHPTGDYSGLNSIMTMNNRKGFLTRGQAAQGVIAGRKLPPSSYFCTQMAPPSRPTTLALSRVISMPQPVMAKTTTTTAAAAAGKVPKIVAAESGAVPKTCAKDNHHVAQHGGISSSSSGGMMMSSSSRPVASSSVVKGTSDSNSPAANSSVSDSLLKHLGSAHMRSGATSSAALSQQQKQSKSGGQLL